MKFYCGPFLCLILAMASPITLAGKTSIEIRVNNDIVTAAPFEAEIVELDYRGSITGLTHENVEIIGVEIKNVSELFDWFTSHATEIKVQFDYKGTKNNSILTNLEETKNNTLSIAFEFEVLPYPKVSLDYSSFTFEGYLMESKMQILFTNKNQNFDDLQQSYIWKLTGDEITESTVNIGKFYFQHHAALLPIYRRINLEFGSTKLLGFLDQEKRELLMYVQEVEKEKTIIELNKVEIWDYRFENLPTNAYKLIPSYIYEEFIESELDGFVFLKMRYILPVELSPKNSEEVQDVDDTKEKVILTLADKDRLGFLCKGNKIEFYIARNEIEMFEDVISQTIAWTCRNTTGKQYYVMSPFNLDKPIPCQDPNYVYVTSTFLPTVAVKTHFGKIFHGTLTPDKKKVQIYEKKSVLENLLKNNTFVSDWSLISALNKETIMSKPFTRDTQPRQVKNIYYAISIQWE